MIVSPWQETALDDGTYKIGEWLKESGFDEGNAIFAQRITAMALCFCRMTGMIPFYGIKSFAVVLMLQRSETLKEIMEYLSDDTKIMEQITVPSEAWVMERLGRVEDILEIQPVTSDNDPNGLLHRENGGYTACIYFTSTGIEAAGDSPVSKGTDGGGAVEVYSTVQDAEARCEYLFDNTILYTGSYAIVGTMVIRISYAYTDEAQYEMTDRIAKAFTQLETA